MSEHYILVGQTAVPAELLEWGRWLEENQQARIVKQTRLLGLCFVSTVFLGLDHQYFPGGPPLIFETMAFWEGEGGYEMERCSTWQEAEEQHESMCREMARPGAFWRFCCRRLRSWWSEARDDWRRGWKDLRGIPRTGIEADLDRLRSRTEEMQSRWWS